MWVLLSSRIRTWLLLAVAVPATRAGIRAAVARLDRGHPDNTAGKALRTADSALARLDRRSKKKHAHVKND